MNSLRPSPELSKDEVEQGLSNIIFDGITTHAFVTLTGGIRIILRFPMNDIDIQSDNNALQCRLERNLHEVTDDDDTKQR